jgi:hypothetical protein
VELIDDEGRLFGGINIIDLLVVLTVLAVVIAGGALVFAGDDGQAGPTLATTNVTLDLGTQPEYIVDQINEGDTYEPGTNSELVVTDVALSPQGGQTRVLVSAQLTAPENNQTVNYNGAPPRLGRSLSIVTDVYEVSGRITNIGGEDSLNTAQREVLVQTTVDTNTATAIQVGDRFEVRERSLATVESVQTYGTTNPDRKRLLVGLQLETLDRGDGPRFAGQQLREGVQIPFETDSYAFTGRVQTTGRVEPRGSVGTHNVTLELTRVSPQRAAVITSGMTESFDGRTLARLTDVTIEPTQVVLTTDDGDITARDHPRLKDITLRATLSVRQTTAGLKFKGQTIQQGSTVVLDLGSVTIRAQIAEL